MTKEAQMSKKPCLDVRHLDIRHSFGLRHSVFVIFGLRQN
jgi:hypothetical protein